LRLFLRGISTTIQLGNNWSASMFTASVWALPLQASRLHAVRSDFFLRLSAASGAPSRVAKTKALGE